MIPMIRRREVLNGGGGARRDRREGRRNSNCELENETADELQLNRVEPGRPLGHTRLVHMGCVRLRFVCS
jgi:hypothetical protein